jgi:predicted nucleic acid-binding protein
LVVVDVSAALSWLFADERDSRAVKMLNELVARGATVPPLWQWELQNALLVAERRGRVTSDQVRQILDDVEALPIGFDARTNMLLGPELTLARRFAISAYDAAYLELAFRKNLPLMTRDKQLAEAASDLGLLWKP